MTRTLFLLFTLFSLLTLGLSACNQTNTSSGQTNASSEDQATTREITVLCLGDSLTAGYGIDDRDAWPKLLETQLRNENHNVKVINAGVSGDTTTGGLKRLDWALKAQPDVVVLCLGANDGLRGIDVALTRENLQKIIQGLQEQDIQILFAGMRLPTNLGPFYRGQFEKIYPELADEYNLTFLPFLLENVAMKKDLNLSDGIHPNEAGQKIIMKHIYEYILPIINDLPENSEGES